MNLAQLDARTNLVQLGARLNPLQLGARLNHLQLDALLSLVHPNLIPLSLVQLDPQPSLIQLVLAKLA